MDIFKHFEIFATQPGEKVPSKTTFDAILSCGENINQGIFNMKICFRIWFLLQTRTFCITFLYLCDNNTMYHHFVNVVLY